MLPMTETSTNQPTLATPSAGGAAVRLTSGAQGAIGLFADKVPEGLVLKALPPGTMLGKPFRCFASGKVFCRYTGVQMGPKEGWTPDHVRAMVTYFYKLGEPVGIDLDHMSFLGSGEVLGLYTKDETEGDLAGHTSLWAVPAYNRLGMEVVSHAHGERLYTSPTISLQPTYDPRTGEEIPPGVFLSVALTFSPAQKQGGVVTQVEFSSKNKGKVSNMAAKKKKYEDPVKDQLPVGNEEIPTDGDPVKDQLPVGEEEIPQPESEGTLPEVVEDQPSSSGEEDPASPQEEEEEMAESPSECEAEEAPCECPEGTLPEDCDCPPEEEKAPVAMSAGSLKALKAELSALRVENKALKANVLALSADKAVGNLIALGKATPAERDAATRAYKAEYGAGVKAAEGMPFRPFTEVFASREKGAKVDFSVKSSSGRDPVGTDKYEAEVAALSAKEGIPFHVAANRLVAMKIAKK